MRYARKYTPYIRKGNPRYDRSESLRMAMRLAYFKVMGKPYYVLCQRGFSHLVLAVEASRREVRQSIVPVLAGWKTFRQWVRDTGRHARGENQRGTPQIC